MFLGPALVWDRVRIHEYRVTSLTRKPPPPWNPPRTLDKVLL